MERLIEVDETVRFEVSFSVANCEEGFEDRHPFRHRRYGLRPLHACLRWMRSASC